METSRIDPFQARARALEDAFFHRVDRELIIELRRTRMREDLRKALLDYSGFKDTSLIDSLLDHGFTPANLAALMLVPAIFVAWADGKVQPSERQAILHHCLANHKGLNPEAMKLIKHWLHEKPEEATWRLWKDFAASVYEQVGQEEALELAQLLHEFATQIAESAGGYLARSNICPSEQAILDDIKSLR